MISIIREKHPTTPLVIISPIWSPPRDEAGSNGGPSLARMREILTEVVAARVKAKDAHIRYLTGLELFGPDDLADLPDLLKALLGQTPDGQLPAPSAPAFLRQPPVSLLPLYDLLLSELQELERKGRVQKAAELVRTLRALPLLPDESGRLHRAAPLLTDALVKESFRFYGQTLRGAKELRPRWKRCVALVDGALGEALGRAYVERTFGADGKTRMQRLVTALSAAMQADIATLPWMSPVTRKEAGAKLAAIENKIGYPERWRDYSSVTISRADLLGNAERATAFEVRRILGKIGKPTVKGASVTGEVLGEERGPKVIAFRFKRRKNVRKKRGHRQAYVRVKISNIEG